MDAYKDDYSKYSGNPKKSIEELTPKAEAGDGNAAWLLYRLYDSLSGIGEYDAQREYRSKSRSWLARAVSMKNALAMLRQAEIWTTEQQPYDWITKLYEELAQMGVAEGQYRLGLRLEKDFPLAAIAWYKKAADQNYIYAISRLANIYLEGKIVPRDENLGLFYCNKGAALNYPGAYHRLGDYYMSRDKDKAIAYYRRARDAGDTLAKEKLWKLGIID